MSTPGALGDELRLALRAGGAWLLLGWTLALGWALVEGASFVREREAARADHLAAGAAELAAHRAAPAPPAPHRIRVAAALPPAPLAVLAIGQQDLLPAAAHVDLLSRPDALLRNHQLQSPASLASGRLDASFVVVVLMPLVLLALCVGQLGEDRERGRLALLVACGAAPGRLLARRLGLRAALVALPLVACSGLAVLATAGPGALGGWLAWLALALAYLAAWTGLAAVLAGPATGTAPAAVRLASAWLVLVLVAPVVLRTVADAAAPLPPRVAGVAELRAAELELVRRSDEVLGRFLDDHPELVPAAGGPTAFVRAAYARAAALQQEMAPRERELEAALAANRRLAHALAYLSPAALTAAALARAAGADERRLAAFRAQLAEHKQAFDPVLLPAVFAGTPVGDAELESLPAFEWREPPPAPPWAALATLLLLGAGLSFAAARRLAHGVGAGPRPVVRTNTRAVER